MNNKNERKYQPQTVNMMAFKNLSVGLFRINMPFFEGGAGGGSQTKKDNDKRHQKNLSNFTGLYKGVFYIKGVPQFTKEKRNKLNLNPSSTLTSKDMNERTD